MDHDDKKERLRVEYVGSYPCDNPEGGRVVYIVSCHKLGDGGEDEIDRGERIKRSRTWGWYATREAAERAVLANVTDMFEANWYDAAVIEEVTEGILPDVTGEWWYRASYAPGADDPQVAPIEKPAWLARTLFFGIG